MAHVPRAAQSDGRSHVHRGPHAEGGGKHKGKGRLEVCGDGAGSAVSVDLHHRGGVRNGRHHPAGTNAVRHPRTDRYQDVGDCDDHCKTVHCQTGVIIKHPLPATHILGGRRRRPWLGVVTAVKRCFLLLFFGFFTPVEDKV
uniref:(northern house mosquito) hypothetical protein n=1 Tax=Culex pipiens TaxID=7175 RepID=A0A8D8BRA8_CULPI